MLKIFISRKAIVDEALTTIGIIFEYCPSFLGTVIETFEPYFIAAIQTNSDAIIKSSLYCLGSICDSLNETNGKLTQYKNGEFCDKIHSALQNHLQVSIQL